MSEESKEFKKVVKLIMVTDQNNNKEYQMFDSGTGSFKVNYGRVGGRFTEENYPIEKWEPLYKSKIKKGYKDVTTLFAETVQSPNGFIDITNPLIKTFINKLQAFAKRSISDNYTVAVSNVTMQQVDEAQRIVDEISNMLAIGNVTQPVNTKLLNLYTVIPRKMNKVQNFIFNFPVITDQNIETVRRLVSSEQDTLDVMKGQVSIKDDSTSIESKGMTILDSIGVKMYTVEQNEVNSIRMKMQDNANTFISAFRVENVKTQKRFNEWIEKAANKDVQTFWHGSRNENWWNILDTGLLIRPSNAVSTGAMFGNSIYFANKFQKSLGYTSKRGSCWTGGTADTGLLSLYDVHVGNQYKIQKHSSDCYNLNEKNLKAKGNYDSVFALRGADLRNDEFMVYNVAQTTIKYIVEV